MNTSAPDYGQQIGQNERRFSLNPENMTALASLCGQNNNHLIQIEDSLQVEIANNSYHFQVTGQTDQIHKADTIIQQLYKDALSGNTVNPETIHLYAQQSNMPNEGNVIATSIKTPRITVKPRGSNQNHFVAGIRNNPVHFGSGPAGTGKTWLAVACALEVLFDKKVERLILTRPAVEAGEKLGFLPGDLSQKVDPYLRPLFDALYDMLGAESTEKMINRNVIEVAPLAFMRGRSLNNACIILDESQNTTPEQMKMLLTRIGFGSRAIITGDLSQVDLPRHMTSGLKHAISILSGVEGTGFTRFDVSDVVRHPVVQHIVRAYDLAAKSQPTRKDTPP